MINEFLILYEKALRDEVELHFVSDGQIINSRISAAEKFQFGISLGLAKYYSDAISDNVKRAIEAKVTQRRMARQGVLMVIKILPVQMAKMILLLMNMDRSIVQKVFELYATGALFIGIAMQ